MKTISKRIEQTPQVFARNPLSLKMFNATTFLITFSASYLAIFAVPLSAFAIFLGHDSDLYRGLGFVLILISLILAVLSDIVFSISLGTKKGHHYPVLDNLISATVCGSMLLVTSPILAILAWITLTIFLLLLFVVASFFSVLVGAESALDSLLWVFNEYLPFWNSLSGFSDRGDINWFVYLFDWLGRYLLFFISLATLGGVIN